MDKKNVEAIYPLSPMQQGLLFHTLQADGDDPGTLQVRCRLEGNLIPERFSAAWDEVLRRHPVLRTVLRWKDLDDPLQIVLRDVEIPLRVEDLREQRPVDQQRRLRACLRDERERGIDLSQIPTMRLALFQTGDAAWQLVWSCHHALLDGWSSALVLRDLIVAYNAQSQEERAALAPAPPFRSYIQWLKRQPEDEAEAFWRTHLDGLSDATPLPFDPPDADALANLTPGHERQTTELSAQTSKALQAVARRHQLTLGTVLHGAWAMLLSRYSGHDAVLFGSTTSGRAIDLPGVESMAGLLINTLPVRAEVGDEATALDVFRALHATQAEQTRYAHSSPSQIHAWSAFPAHRRLFDSLMVIENYPHATVTDGALSLHDLQSGITSNFPLTLLVNPGETLHVQVLYDRRRFGQAAMTRLLFAFEHLLGRLAEDPDQTVADMLPERIVGSTTARTTTETPSERSHLGLDDYAAPRDAFEHQLAELWETVLNVQSIGIHDNFFELGGQSMQAIQLLNRVERGFDQKLPLALLFEASTVARMADVLRGDETVQAWDSLVPLNPGGSRPPLYCIHSFDGQVMFYQHLARQLGPDQPVYGLQAVGLDGTADPAPDVQTMAGRYLEEIRSVQPEGPYTLLAICFGIAVALEMGRTLVAEGEAVPMIYVLDSSFAHLRREEVGAQPRSTRTKLQRAFGMLRDGSLIRDLPDHLAVHGRKLVRPLKRLQREQETAAEGPQEHRIWRVNDANVKAWEQYRATPYDGAVTLVRSSAWANWAGKAWHVPVWEELALGGLTVRIVPGNHEDMLHEPYVQALAAQILEDTAPHGTDATVETVRPAAISEAE